MRKFTIVLGVLIALVAAVRFFLPEVLGVAINLTCHEPISKSCQVRMRSLGHVYAARGNLPRALGWYTSAARSGDRVAMFHAGWAERQFLVAEMQERVNRAVEGDGTVYVPAGDGTHDHAALDWYTRSAEAGFAPAMNNLGEMYRDGVLGRNPEPHTAFYWHSKAADLGNPFAQLNLAADYQSGFGAGRSTVLAEYWANLPRETKDAADLAEPTLARTRIFRAGDRHLIDAMKRMGDLPENWDFEAVLARVHAR